MRVEAIQRLAEGTEKLTRVSRQDPPVSKVADATTIPAKEDSSVRQLRASDQLQQAQTQDNDRDSRKSNREKDVSENEVMRAAEFLNKLAKIFDFKLQFRVHKETQRIFAKIIDPDTQKVIREVPPEKMLDMLARMEEMLDDMEGVLLDCYV